MSSKATESRASIANLFLFSFAILKRRQAPARCFLDFTLVPVLSAVSLSADGKCLLRDAREQLCVNGDGLCYEVLPLVLIQSSALFTLQLHADFLQSYDEFC